MKMLKDIKIRVAETPRMAIESVTVTPEIARAWLDKNTHNRPRSVKSIASYTRDMANGNWIMTGDAIRFDQKGNLIDGQHRLYACIEACVPFESLVMYGVEPRAMDVIDTAKRRNARDVLALHGYHNTVILVTAARWIMAYKMGSERSDGWLASNQEVIDCVKANKELASSCHTARGGVGPYPGVLAFLYYAGAHLLKMPETAETFVNVFKSGIPSRDGCPAHKTREFLLQDKHRGFGMKREHHGRLMFKTWNVFADNSTIERISIPKASVEIDGLPRERMRVK